MTYLELIRDAEHKLEHNEITFGEYNEMIEPLRREMGQEPCENCVSRQVVKDVLNNHWLNGMVAHRIIEVNGIVAHRIIEELTDTIDKLPSVKPQKSIVNNGTMNITL